MDSLNQKCLDWGSARQISVQVSLRSIAFSHLVHFPCCLMPAIVLLLVSSVTALTSSPWISCLLSSHWALLCWGDGKLPKPVLPLATAPTTALRPPHTAQTSNCLIRPLTDHSVASCLTHSAESCIEHTASMCCQLHSSVFILRSRKKC